MVSWITDTLSKMNLSRTKGNLICIHQFWKEGLESDLESLGENRIGCAQKNYGLPIT